MATFSSTLLLCSEQKKSIETYKETGKGLSRSALNALLPSLKKEREWLKTEVYSQSLQQTSLNLSRAFINFLEKRAKFPRFKSKQRKQSVGFPQSVRIEGDYIYLPKIKLVKAVFDRKYYGKIKTVTVTKDSSDRYFASIIYEVEACFISGNGNKIPSSYLSKELDTLTPWGVLGHFFDQFFKE